MADYEVLRGTHISVNTLARLMGVDYYALYRYLNGSQGSLSDDQVRKLHVISDRYRRLAQELTTAR